MKPETYTLKEWFAKFIIKPFRKSLKEWKEAFLLVFFGYWYCFGCETIHSRRTVQYPMKDRFSFKTSNINCCSLHKDK